MAPLPPNEIQAARAAFLHENRGETMSILKSDLTAAVTAADVWADDNAAAFNLAIPQPARAAMTPKQKSRLLLAVVRQRYEVT